ncbi:MAG: hypothetical protein QOJ31_1181 [Gaiellales bacterium]|jgi:hypothetical protein|nr:hypothetical protein [Gaiellales bacterium]
MHRSKRLPLAAATVVGCTLAFAGAAGAFPALPGVSPAQPKAAGVPAPTLLSPGLAQIEITRGSEALDGGTSAVPYYGYDGDGPLLPAPGDLPTASHTVEATKTEPDKNTYLVLKGQTGPDQSYDYGTHFLFQGHEHSSPGYITRINLDADAAHRVTLMATQDVNGNDLANIDGSTWDPFAKRLIFTTESSSAGEYQATAGYPSRVRDISGYIGRGGYEGVQNDSAGNLWFVEDVGGAKGTVNSHAKQPNSFLYRYTPADPYHLTAGGVLQALQVMSRRTATPIVFHSGAADADILSNDTRDLRTYGLTFKTRWVTIHDTAVDGTTPFDANSLAKAAGATPFKRPENGVFRPGTDFRQFVFDETGDTDINTEAGSQDGGFGSLFRLNQANPSANTGSLNLLYRGDATHAAFDNLAFADNHNLIVVEDAGDTLHSQRNGFDSMWQLNAAAGYGNPATPAPVRLLAQGRDPSATLDSAFLGMTGFQNDGDNEITGIHISDGAASVSGILGVKTPRPLVAGSAWRTFYTAQHGDNVTYELILHR